MVALSGAGPPTESPLATDKMTVFTTSQDQVSPDGHIICRCLYDSTTTNLDWAILFIMLGAFSWLTQLTVALAIWKKLTKLLSHATMLVQETKDHQTSNGALFVNTLSSLLIKISAIFSLLEISKQRVHFHTPASSSDDVNPPIPVPMRPRGKTASLLTTTSEPSLYQVPLLPVPPPSVRQQDFLLDEALGAHCV